jgi:hypothetical protein
MTTKELNDKLEVIDFWLEGMELEMTQIQNNKPTKKIVLENLDQWINTLNNIKGIIEYGTI